MIRAKYLWLDLETTGLDPATCSIIEAAWLCTDEKLEQVGEQFSYPIHTARHVLDGMGEFCREMHTKNNLLRHVDRGGYDVSHVMQCLHAVITRTEWTEGKPILAGATVHFDRGFLKHWAPSIEALLHHRHLDVSSLKLARCDLTGCTFAKAEAHRALDDVFESLGQAREIYEEHEESAARRWHELVALLGERGLGAGEPADFVGIADRLVEIVQREKLRAEAAEEELATLHDQLDALGEREL